MATLILGNMAASALSPAFGVLGSIIGYGAGSLVGNFVDNKIFGNSQTLAKHGFRMKDLFFQSSSYGHTIPKVYGETRTAGNIIWSNGICEHQNTHRQKIKTGKGGGKKTSQIYTDYSYTASFAIAVCEGPIDSIIRIWADTNLITSSYTNYRIYYGDELQMPDPLIESICGYGKTPAYRNLSYIVFEDFPLTEFGNRIPNFTFEVLVKPKLINSDLVEDIIKAMVIIPGSGEFIYDTNIQKKIYGQYIENQWIQEGKAEKINCNTHINKADSLVSLDQLLNTCKNLKWVSPVVCWFTNSIDIKDANIYPAVEYQHAINKPDKWTVAGLNRDQAKIILKDNEGDPIYGGTINDNSLLRYVEQCKAQNLKVMINPMVMVELYHKPWRGRISGDVKYISKFFNDVKGYKNFILHYANLLKDKVDAFIIGSELKELTALNINNKFPAVSELINLAKEVKNILGPEVIITYAADWSEYHHTDKGWYHLDELWASTYIDVIGIDAYFPLTNGEKENYSVEEIIEGINTGEGINYVINNNQKCEISPKYAWKNIRHWWENYHYNPDGRKTSWQPKMKKIWFTEYGFPSVSGATNQPNVFYDPCSSESNLPKNSNGMIDFQVQRNGITAIEKFYQSNDMVELKFLWCWDARPFPAWPLIKDRWKDTELWYYGHWVNGKIGIASLAAVITDLCFNAGIMPHQIDVSRLINKSFEGIYLNEDLSFKDIIALLQLTYFFSVFEENGIIKFVPNEFLSKYNILNENLICENEKIINISIDHNIELPQKIDVIFYDKHLNYQESLASAQRNRVNSCKVETVTLPLVLTRYQAQKIAEKILFDSWAKKMSFKFSLGPKHLFIKVGDLVKIDKYKDFDLQITHINNQNNEILEIEAVRFFENNYCNQYEKFILQENFLLNVPDMDNIVKIFELPEMSSEHTNKVKLYFASCNKNESWSPLSIYKYSNNESEYISDIKYESIIGSVTNYQGCNKNFILDHSSIIIVSLISGELYSSGNYQYAIINNQVIGFKNAKLIKNHVYELSDFVQGLIGTEENNEIIKIGDDFILLDESIFCLELFHENINKTLSFKFANFNDNITNLPLISYNILGTNLKPLSPVHAKIKKTDNNLLINWQRRSRVNIGLIDNIDIQLAETNEKYLIKIFGDENLICMQEVEESSFSYLLSSNYLSISCEISQISEIYGPGEIRKIYVE